MPSYGEWIQAPDYEADGGGSSPKNYGAFQYAIAEVAPEESYHVPTDSEVRGIQSDTATWPHTVMPDDPRVPVPSLASFSSHLTAQVDYITEFDIGPVLKRTTLAAIYQTRIIGWSPWSGGLRNWAPFLLGSIPEGAIGWQWQSDMSEGEGKPSDAVGCVGTFTIDGASYEKAGSIGAETVPLDVGYATQVLAVPAVFLSDTEEPGDSLFDDAVVALDGSALDGPVLATMTGADDSDYDGPPRTFDLDLTPYMDDQGRVAMTQRPDPAVPMPLPTGWSPDDDGSTWTHQYRAVAGSVTYTFRPPVFRWIYDNLTPAPPLRRRQRDDGALSAPRRNSRASSQQRSLRNRGYL